MNSRLSQFEPVTRVAKELGISRRAVLHRIEAGTLAAEKAGEGRTSAYLVHRDEIERAKSAATQTSGGAPVAVGGEEVAGPSPEAGHLLGTRSRS